MTAPATAPPGVGLVLKREPAAARVWWGCLIIAGITLLLHAADWGCCALLSGLLFGLAMTGAVVQVLLAVFPLWPVVAFVVLSIAGVLALIAGLPFGAFAVDLGFWPGEGPSPERVVTAVNAYVAALGLSALMILRERALTVSIDDDGMHARSGPFWPRVAIRWADITGIDLVPDAAAFPYGHVAGSSAVRVRAGWRRITLGWMWWTPVASRLDPGAIVALLRSRADAAQTAAARADAARPSLPQ